MSIRLDAEIVAVTVYPGQARVTRRGVATVEAGDQRVRLGGLPNTLLVDSVRVTGRGPATVLGVDVLSERHARTPDSAIADLERRRDDLVESLAELSDQDSVLAGRAELVTTLATRSGSTFAQALARGETDPARVAEVGDALAGQFAAVLADRRALARSRRAVQEEYEEAERTLADRRAAFDGPDRMAVDVDLTVTEAAEVEFEVSYLVYGGNWESRYDLRLVGEKLTVTWYGLISQHTGEDWPECDLRLSTAQPTDGVTVPELSPWFVDIRKPVPAAPKMESYGAVGRGGAMPMAAAAPMMFDAVATVEHGTTATTYRPARPVAVPADGTSHRTTVAVIDLAARLDHVTVPVIGVEAYLRATVTNTSEYVLRPGRASIFHDGEFVGVTDLEPWATGEETELTLGVDERIRVERELVRRSAGKAVLGGTRRQEAGYKITVGNFRSEEARITVIDQVPVSRHESVVVRDLVLRPDPVERTELGEVTWQVTLAQGESTEIELGFRLDVAKGVELAGWRD